MKTNEISVGWALRQPDPVAALQRVVDNVKNYGSRRLADMRTAAAALVPALVLAAQALLVCAFCFSLLFVCAVIGG